VRVNAKYQGGKGYRVFMDGQDVTNRCVEVDDKEGWAECLVFEDNGNVMVNPGGSPVHVMLTGNVEIVPPLPPLPWWLQ
jgi:hypothetical protein